MPLLNSPIKAGRPLYPLGRGFTLIELLVTLAIVAVLASILLPVLSAGRERANEAKCVSNLRQSAAAMLALAVDNRGVLQFKIGGSGGAKNLWSAQAAAYIAPEGNNAYRKPALDVLYCPGHAPNRHAPETSTWSWNCYGGYFVTTPSVKKTSIIENGQTWSGLEIRLVNLDASAYPMLMDSLHPAQKTQWMGILSWTAATDNGAVHLRHKGRANVAFYDGHVAALDRAALKELGFNSAYNEERLRIGL